MAALGLPCSAQAFSSCGNRGLLCSCGARAPHCSGAGALGYGLRSCGIWAWFPRSMWNLWGPGIKLVSPFLAGGFTTGPPRKSFF